MNHLTTAVLGRVPRLEAVLPRARTTATDPPPPRVGPLPATRGRWLLALTGTFVLSRAAYAVAGVRFDASALHPAKVSQVQWQLLPPDLLRHDLWRSLWNLHSQPPLYNLFCGLLVRLPGAWQAPVAAIAFLLLGLALALVTFLLLAEFGVRDPKAFVVAVLALGNPAFVLYENWLSWSYPTAVLLTVGTYLLMRWSRTRRLLYAAASMSCFAAVVLLDATFQWPWLLAMAVLVVAVCRHRWRQAVVLTSLPLALVAGWYVKDAVQFGSTTTSSWLGMNLYETTIGQDRAADVRHLIRQGRLDPLAAVPAFQPVNAYSPPAGDRPSGVPALDRRTSALGVPNYDNSTYVGVSRRYVGDDLRFMVARPAHYARSVALATSVWAVPEDQYDWIKGNYGTLAGYARLYDGAVMLQAQPEGDRAAMRAELRGTRPPAGAVSWTAALITVIDLLLAPAVVFLVRRRNRVSIACPAAMWLTVSYSFIVTSLTEVGENMRFRFELGALPVLLAVAAIHLLVREIRYRRGQAG